MRSLVLLLLLAACAAPVENRELAADEIDARDVVLPPDARAGGGSTWSITQSDGDDRMGL